jgi:hypothetical protein
MSDIPVFPFNRDELNTNSFDSDDVFYRRAVEMIDVGYNSGLEKITLFKLEDPEKDYYLNLPEYNWEETLEDALKHFEMIEDYEMCSYAKDVLGRITE